MPPGNGSGSRQILESHPQRTLVGKSFLLLCLWAFGVQSAVVNPDPNSRLKNKKVLVLTGGDVMDHGPARDATLANLQALATKIPFTLVAGNPLALTDASLANSDIIVFNYFFQSEVASVFPDSSKAAFQRWLKKSGHGWVGYHTSGANEYAKAEWIWFQDNVTGMRYSLHASGTPQAKITKTTDTKILTSPIMSGLPAEYSAQDEWYDYQTDSKLFSDGSKVMYYLSDAATMTPPRLPNPIHPVAWFREDTNKVRYFFTPMGHTLATASSDWFQSVLLRALEYVSGDPTLGTLASPTSFHRFSTASARFCSGSTLDRPESHHTAWTPDGRHRKIFSGEANDRATSFGHSGVFLFTSDSSASDLR